MEATLPEKVALGVTEPSNLVVASNWSIHDASLKELGSPFSVNLVPLFLAMCQQMISVGVPGPVPQPVADAPQPPAAEGAPCTGPDGPEGQQTATVWWQLAVALCGGSWTTSSRLWTSARATS
jgi:hypothetical protein